MDTQIRRKQMVMLVLSSVLAIGSYWIPLPPGALTRNPELSKRVAQSIPVESGILARKPATARRFQ